MSIGICFLVVWIVALLFCGYGAFKEHAWPAATSIIVLILLGLLGWAQFGPVIQ